MGLKPGNPLQIGRPHLQHPVRCFNGYKGCRVCFKDGSAVYNDIIRQIPQGYKKFQSLVPCHFRIVHQAFSRFVPQQADVFTPRHRDTGFQDAALCQPRRCQKEPQGSIMHCPCRKQCGDYGSERVAQNQNHVLSSGCKGACQLDSGCGLSAPRTPHDSQHFVLFHMDTPLSVSARIPINIFNLSCLLIPDCLNHQPCH